MERFDKGRVQALTKLRSRLTYANAMSTIAVFVALGGGAYAVSVPRNSVGTTQLKANAVTAAKVKNRSLLASDFKRGQLRLGTAARADDQDPPAAPSGTDVARMTLTTNSPGKIFVIGSLRDPFLTCADAGCSAQWGAYVDDKPVPNTGATLSGGCPTPRRTLNGGPPASSAPVGSVRGDQAKSDEDRRNRHEEGNRTASRDA